MTDLTCFCIIGITCLLVFHNGSEWIHFLFLTWSLLLYHTFLFIQNQNINFINLSHVGFH